MQSNLTTTTPRVEIYKRDPDPLPQVSPATAVTLHRDWQAAHASAMSHDAALHIYRC